MDRLRRSKHAPQIKLRRELYRMAEFWYSITSWIQNPLADFWLKMLDWPVIGVILAFFEATFGR